MLLNKECTTLKNTPLCSYHRLNLEGILKAYLFLRKPLTRTGYCGKGTGRRHAESRD